ncbi:MAG: response regulator [Deltaproteobacteria bacterium]|nr:response regulator [Candidatus Anaeroferrophillacea bacterium]
MHDVPDDRPLSTILAVDDDVFTLETFASFLDRQGYEVLRAVDGREAVDLVAARPVDLVLMDAAMPVMDGFEATRRIKELPGGQRLPVIMVTALEDDGLVDRAFAAGAEEYITKPIHWGVLRQRVHFLLERARVETRRWELERKMQETQKLESLGLLAGGIAHDFNNLLTGVIGNADLAMLNLSAESPAQPFLRRVKATAERLADLSQQMLAYSGKGKFIIEPLSLSRLVEEMSHLLAVSIPKRMTIKYYLADNLPPFEGDATQIRQVIMNLLTNAAEACGDGPGSISVTTGVIDADKQYLETTYLHDDLQAGRYVFLEVSDSGCGMDEETRERIFDPFFTTKFTGRGLGLAVVLGIVRGHCGALRVYSEPGRGSTFKLLFPALAATADLAVPADAWKDDFVQATGTLLVIDDEEAVRETVSLMLTHSGYDVLVAASGSEGIDIFRRRMNDVRLVLLDLTMPKMSGEEVFRELRRLRPEVPVIIASGFNEQEVVHRFAGKSLAGFIQKPFRLETLLDKLREVLNG